MFGTPRSAQKSGCSCGRSPEEVAVTSLRSISGSYRSYRCACGSAWTERSDPPEHWIEGDRPSLREFHEQLQAMHREFK
ncbi:MAG: hypothetical protein ACREN8_09875 [Candidatus Dormibacteraceae bacterium]